MSVCFKKVDAHPEKRKHTSDWLAEEKGNFLADQVAGGLVEPSYIISASKWLSWIASSSKIVLKKKDGTPLITDIRRHKSSADLKDCLTERQIQGQRWKAGSVGRCQHSLPPQIDGPF